MQYNLDWSKDPIQRRNTTKYNLFKNRPIWIDQNTSIVNTNMQYSQFENRIINETLL